MQEIISSERFVELMAAEMLGYFGPYRDDRRIGILTSVVANSQPFRSKDAKTWEPKDFFPHLAERKKQTAKEIMAQMRAWTLAHGGKVKTAVKDGN